MEAPLKQRLIGAIVLAALALIFVPMLLKSPDVKDPDSADVPLQIPDEADSDGIKTIEIPLDGSTPIVTAPKPAAAPVSAMPAPVETLIEPSGVPSAGVEDGVQTAAGQYAVVITAKDDAEAKAISAGLLKKGMTSTIQSNGQRFRVRIGPFAGREQAELARLRSTEVVTGGTVVAMDAVAAPVTSATAPVPATAPKPTAIQPAPATAPVVAETKPAIKTEPASTDKGYAVQIGAPANEAAAIGLRDKARAAGFNSFIQPVETETGRRYRVRIGPEHTRDEANRLLASVKQKLGGDGIVVKHP
jgi:cell division septation protein DedD